MQFYNVILQKNSTEIDESCLLNQFQTYCGLFQTCKIQQTEQM